MPLHPLIADAAGGTLPAWAEASPGRRQHVARVADLMTTWAERRSLSEEDRDRWHAAGLLHDVLRDAHADRLRDLVTPDLRDLPAKMLHGPAAATRLRQLGVDDPPLLLAIAWHTLGHRDFDDLGKALYLADYTEPGRSYESEELARKRDRAPRELEPVVREVAVDRIGRSLQDGHPLLAATVGFWNTLVEN